MRSTRASLAARSREAGKYRITSGSAFIAANGSRSSSRQRRMTRRASVRTTSNRGLTRPAQPAAAGRQLSREAAPGAPSVQCVRRAHPPRVGHELLQAPGVHVRQAQHHQRPAVVAGRGEEQPGLAEEGEPASPPRPRRTAPRCRSGLPAAGPGGGAPGRTRRTRGHPPGSRTRRFRSPPRRAGPAPGGGRHRRRPSRSLPVGAPA